MLTLTKIGKIKPTNKIQFNLDYDSLYLVVNPKSKKHPKGRKYWLCRTEFKGKGFKKVFGEYDDITLDEARELRRDFKARVRLGLSLDNKVSPDSWLASDFVEKYAEFKKINQKALKKNKQTGKMELRWKVELARTAERVVNMVIRYLGDRPPHEYTKIEINAMTISRMVDDKVKTGTIRKDLNIISAVFNLVYEEFEIDRVHRFRKIKIAKEKEDKKERLDFSSKDLATLRRTINGSDNVSEQIIGLLLDTGMRCSEVAGLQSKDIIIDCEYPYINLHRNPFRRLKNKNSQRVVPLVGASLQAAKTLNLSGEWVFGRYVKRAKEEGNWDSANGSVNNRIKVILKSNEKTSHSFRHTLATRLRSVECPRHLQEEIGGWAKSISDNYGSPTDIKIKGKYIKKSLDW